MWSELLLVAMGSTPRVRARVRKAWTVIKLESGVRVVQRGDERRRRRPAKATDDDSSDDESDMNTER